MVSTTIALKAAMPGPATTTATPGRWISALVTATTNTSSIDQHPTHSTAW